MPLIYNSTSADENYPTITSMLRKTKPRDSGKRPALAPLTNVLQQSTTSDLGKQIRQRQSNPLSVRVDAKKPSPKQKQMASRVLRTSQCSNRINSTTATTSTRQSTLSSFMSARASSSASSSSASSSNAFTVFKDRTTPVATPVLTPSCSTKTQQPTPMSVQQPTVAAAPRNTSFRTVPTSAAATPRNTAAAPLAPRNISFMEVEEERDVSLMDTSGIRDIDADCHPEFDSPEYTQDIDAYLRQKEVEYQPRPLYMLKQNEVRFCHRSLTVNWMHEVCLGIRSLNQTVFQLAVSYLDRFLSKIQFKLRRLQLLAIACLYIAKKVDSMGEPDFDVDGHAFAAYLCSLTENTFNKEQLLKMERLVLSKLAFEVNSTVPTSFCDRFLKASDGDCREKYFMMYLVDRAYVKGEEFLRFAPSLLTASAIGLARAHLRPSEPLWTPTLAHYTRYSATDIRECMGHLLNMYRADHAVNNTDNNGPWSQYRDARYMSVLETTPIARLPSSC